MSKPYRSVVYSSSIHVILSLIKQRAKENIHRGRHAQPYWTTTMQQYDNSCMYVRYFVYRLLQPFFCNFKRVKFVSIA